MRKGFKFVTHGMRRMRQIAGAVMLALFCSLAQAQDSANRSNDMRHVKPRWSVSDWECLPPMGEPSLLEARDQQANAYRFIYQHSMQHKPLVVRISIRPDGTGEVITKILTYAADCKTGKLTKNKKRVVPKKAVDALLKRVEEADFWQLPAEDSVIGPDGATWIVEGVKDGRYHVVNRWSPRRGEYKRLGEEFAKLGRLRFPGG